MHKPNRPGLRLGIVATLVAALTLVAGPAFAHVTANPDEGPADGFFKTVFRVGHGCEGSPTTTVRIQIPEGVVSVKPQVKPGWDIDLTEGELAEPVDLHGETITEGVTEVAWTGGSLPDAYMDEFGLSMKLPARPGETLYFPVVQECEQGTHRWIQIPDSVEQWGELDEPAPFVTLTAAANGHEEGDAAAGPGEGQRGAGEAAAADDTAPTSATGGATNPLVFAALALGAIGVLAGGGALWRTQRAA